MKIKHGVNCKKEYDLHYPYGKNHYGPNSPYAVVGIYDFKEKTYCGRCHSELNKEEIIIEEAKLELN